VLANPPADPSEAPDTPFSQRYTELDRMLTEQVCDLIAALLRRGKLTAGVSAKMVGEVVFNNLNQMFIEFVKSDTMDMATLRAAVRRQTALIVGALAD
jgi:hypothetical protein